MPKKIKILCLSDHLGHSSENSIYALVRTMIQHPQCAYIDIASRGNIENNKFFHTFATEKLEVIRAHNDLKWDKSGQQFLTNTRTVSVSDYDWIFLRLPRPIPDGFFSFLMRIFPETRIINSPSGILETSSKAFLLEVPEICPPIQLISNLNELEQFKNRFPIVLKPFLNYGGKGILKIKDDLVWEANASIPYERWLAQQKSDSFAYLGMKYMENVHLGDKRIIVCNGRMLSAALRYPAPGSWMCNVAQGGYSVPSEPATEEFAIIELLNQKLLARGIIMYGMDTLSDENGKRVLSEINTLSVGGIAPSGQIVVQKAADGLWEYILSF